MSVANPQSADLPWTPDFESYAVTHAIQSARIADDAVEVSWDDGHTSAHHALWLRENSPDDATVHPLSRELLVDPLDLPDDVVATEAGVDDAGALVVAWSHDGLVSRYHPGWLRAHAWFETVSENVDEGVSQVLWTAQSLGDPATFDGPAALKDPGVLMPWLEALRDYGIARLEGLPVENGILEQLLGQIGPIRETNFGRLFDVIVKNDPDSNAYTSSALVPHMDLGTREAPPGLQFLFCRINTTQGGEGLYVDGFKVAEDMRQDEPENFAALVEIAWEFKNRAQDSDYRTVGPVFHLASDGRVDDVRYTPWLRAPLKAGLDVQRRAYRSLRAFMRRCRWPEYELRITYRPGDLLAFDNRRVLHGRSAYDAVAGDRYLEGCYAERDDLRSAIRILRRRAGQVSAGQP